MSLNFDLEMQSTAKFLPHSKTEVCLKNFVREEGGDGREFQRPGRKFSEKLKRLLKFKASISLET